MGHQRPNEGDLLSRPCAVNTDRPTRGRSGVAALRGMLVSLPPSGEGFSAPKTCTRSASVALLAAAGRRIP